MTTRHKWSRKPHRETVEGEEQDVKDCEACGMSRTTWGEFSHKAQVFRRKGETTWSGYRAGYIPDCVPVQEGK